MPYRTAKALSSTDGVPSRSTMSSAILSCASSASNSHGLTSRAVRSTMLLFSGRCNATTGSGIRVFPPEFLHLCFDILHTGGYLLTFRHGFFCEVRKVSRNIPHFSDEIYHVLFLFRGALVA